MKICFVLPKFTRQPIGGYKIVFEYANRLCGEGHQIDIIFLNEDALMQFKIPGFVRKIVANILTKRHPQWFPLNKKINKLSSLNKHYLKRENDYDVVFATGVQTTELVHNYFEKAHKIYLIQGYENWGISEEKLWETYNYGFTNVVVSNWLKQVVDTHSQGFASILLKNPIDIQVYKAKVPQQQRQDHTIGLLYHTEKIKGVQYALKALELLKEKYNDLSVEMFGMFPRPDDLPEWIHYKRGASQSETVEIYNKVQVFLCASIEEGYGLTGLEAMACGACLVSTSYKGVLEYAEDKNNAYLSPIKDSQALCDNVSKLFDDLKERERISRNGVESVKQYSWDETMKRLRQIIDKR